MPSDGNFGFSVVIAGLPVPEYTKEGRVYVESNLWTPVSYAQRVRELAYGEVEEQDWPVTPYQVKVVTAPHCTDSWYILCIDGVEVREWVLKGGKEWIFDGFQDADGTREFLFALPRFARDEHDRVASGRQSQIGTIEVVRYSATYLRNQYWSVKDTDFKQANKKDAREVTGGSHTMSTTKKGKLLPDSRPPSEYWEIWDYGGELGRLSVHYHMAHTLQDMGITIQQMDWSQAQHSRTVKKETN